MASDDLHAQLAELTCSFKARLQGELQSMSARSRELLGQPTADATNLAELRAQLHKLAGSAGTFGFADLGTEARAL
ncbi:MAG: Hpt domain-containing protein, partial [Halopseudomonas sp.]